MAGEVELFVDGDDTSVPGVINHESLTRRLAIEAEPLSERTDVEVTTSRYVGYPVRGFEQRTFGGHLVAQAILASAATVDDPARVVNSLHAYFLRTGTHTRRLQYDVTTVRDGGSFSIREVSVIQAERELARLSLSFCTPDAAGRPDNTAASPAPAVPPPDSVEPVHRRRLLELPADGIKLPARENWQTASRPVDIRYIDGTTDDRRFWFRTAPAAGTDQNTHRAVLAFASDRSLLPVISHARGDLERAHMMRTASIDHNLWFHRDVRSGDWYLYVQNSSSNTPRSGLAEGRIFNEHGGLVATVVQQGIITES
ncbi:acyl-CoA thioesterase [Rhodococcus sp. UNC23MFCrub1.1]|uniref:acyl-CoA thioesterase n=1 Tax=Rhodococcus sp. UNC23MFCrub1.1 TaxID=1449068 RepID=UPI000486BBC5|nr:acyl-CoA thioesterase domain-containing protein [Rhodococcus sp. UNC23MFCrub1.1]